MAGNVKLSKAQIAVLERMATGDEVWTTTGRSPSVFWHADLHASRPSRSTILALARSGMVLNTERDELKWRGSKYQITSKGRAALRSQP